MIAAGAAVREVLDAICSLAQDAWPGAEVGVLLPRGHRLVYSAGLRTRAFRDEYNQSPSSASLPVPAEAIDQTDPRWSSHLKHAATFGLTNCLPEIMRSSGGQEETLGVLVVYRPTDRPLAPCQALLVRESLQLAILAIERHLSTQKLSEMMERVTLARDEEERQSIELATRAAEMEVLRNLADQASRSKSEFLANTSHEIRTPLTAILGYADLLRDEEQNLPDSHERLKLIDTIRNAGTHLLTVINDILDVSKIEAGKMTVESIETSLPRILVEVESLLRPRATSKGLVLAVGVSSPVPEFVLSDPTRLRQILMNLAGNAIKFTESGRVRITASAAGDGDHRRVRIAVEDTGPGLTEQQAGRLFSAFTQADSSVTRKHGGTGLGLTICRQLALLMGGDVSLTWTTPGKGSCFVLELPLQCNPGTAMVESLSTVAAASPERVGPDIRLSGRILLAEDGRDNQRLIAFHLRKAGAEVDIADNGKIALDMLDAQDRAGAPYALLLTDIQMPEMDGYMLAQTLRARGCTMSIVALTAHAMAEDRARCIAAGCDDHATKPIDKSMLLRTCARWLGQTRKSAAA